MILFPYVIQAMPEGDDRDYMEWLYEKYYRLMYATAWKYSKELPEVEDIVSDSCVSLMGKIGTLRTLDKNRLSSYIISTVRNTALDSFRKQQTVEHNTVCFENVMDSLIDKEGHNHQIELIEELVQVIAVIRELPSKERQIMQMKYFQHLGDEEIALRVGLSANSIRKYIERARTRIKAKVYKSDGDRHDE